MKIPLGQVWAVFLTIFLLVLIGWLFSPGVAWSLLVMIIIGGIGDFLSDYQSRKQKGEYYDTHERKTR